MLRGTWEGVETINNRVASMLNILNIQCPVQYDFVRRHLHSAQRLSLRNRIFVVT